MFCWRCGARLREGDCFCANCGAQSAESLPNSETVPTVSEIRQTTSPTPSSTQHVSSVPTCKRFRVWIIAALCACLAVLMVFAVLWLVKEPQTREEEREGQQSIGNVDSEFDDDTDDTSENSAAGVDSPPGNSENSPSDSVDGGYSSSQEWYAPADSQFNQQTDVARIFWTCSPQSAIGNNFQYQLNDDQSELMIRAYPVYPEQMVPVDCLASQLGMDSAMLQSGEGSIPGGDRHIWRIGNMKVTCRPMSTDTGGWIDLWIRQEH